MKEVSRGNQPAVRWRAGAAGACAAGTTAGVAELLAGLSPSVSSSYVALSETTSLGGALAVVAIVVIPAILAAAVAALAGRGRSAPAVGGFALLGFAGAIAASALTGSTGPSAWSAYSVAVVTGMVVLWLLLGSARASGPGPEVVDDDGDRDGGPLSRRSFVTFVGGSVLGATVAGVVGAYLSLRRERSADRPVEPRRGTPGRPSVRGVEPEEDVEEVEVPSSIDASGRSDVGAELTAFLATVRGPATVVFPAGAEYRIDDGTVWLTRATGITLDFRNATLRRTRILDHHLRYTESTPYLRLDHCTDTTVRNLRVRGVNTNDPAVYEKWPETVFFQNRSQPKVEGVEGGLEATGWRGGFEKGEWWVLNNDRSGWEWCVFGPPSRFTDEPGEWGSYCVALEFEHGVRADGGSNIVVEDCDLAGMGGDGVYGHGDDLDGMTVRRVKVRRNGRQGVAFNAGQNYLVEDCNIWSRRAAVDLEPDRAGTPLREIEIRRCVLRSQLLAVACGGAGEVNDVNIHDNVILDCGTPAFYVSSNREPGNGLPDARPRGYHKRHNWRFEGNIDRSDGRTGPRAGIHLDNVHGVVIARNVLPRSGGEGTAVASVEWHSSDVEIYDNDFSGQPEVFEDGGPEWDARLWAVRNGYEDHEGDVARLESSWRQWNNTVA